MGSTSLRPTQRAQRGASTVEVALVIALVAVVVIGAAQFVGRGSESSIEAAGTGIQNGSEDDDGEGDGGPSGGGGGDGGDGGGGGGSGGPAGPSPTTTTAPTPTSSPPATTSSTTSVPPATTAPTTTATPTTAPPAPPAPPAAASTTLGPLEASRSGGSWDASSTLELRLDDGTAVPGATVTLQVSTYRPSGSSRGWTTTEIQVETGPDGRVELGFGPFPRNGGNRVEWLNVEVVEVSAAGGAAWDGDRPSASTSVP